MKMYVAGSWVDSPQMMTVQSPFSGEAIGEVPQASDDQIEQALEAAVEGARQMAALSAYERSRIICKAADLLAQPATSEKLAHTLTLEEGKPIGESRAEISRMPDLLRLCAFEGSQIRGETLPLEAQMATTGKIGLSLRVPCGVVVAITPFNYPVLLVLHKLGPALATGNAVIHKPPLQTSMVALLLVEIFLEAGLPPKGLQCITGSGSKLGPSLCRDTRVRKISFTGSAEVGQEITRIAGVKKLSLELGSNSPVVVLPDADIEQVADAIATGGYVNAGQVCISAQRILADQGIYTDLLDALVARVRAIKIGNPLDDGTKLSAMISVREAERVIACISEAAQQGGRVVTGGERDGAVVSPTVVADVRPDMRISTDELFGPAVGVTPVKNVDEAIGMANDSKFGLGAGVFTRDINNAMRFAREVECGNIMINWTPLWRADLMPYGGLKQSGIGKEGPRYAVQEMTDVKTVVFHGLPAPRA